MKALIIGDNYDLIYALPSMLARAGFASDIITSVAMLKHSIYLNQMFLLARNQMKAGSIAEHIASHKTLYDWVIVTDDDLLLEIATSPLPSEVKLKLLPVKSVDNFAAIYSKIGVAQVFQQHSIPAPDFHVVSSVAEAHRAASNLGFPVIVKIDASSGGVGVYECTSADDIAALSHLISNKPMLMQKKMFGAELDLSAIFFEGKLVHFSYSIFRKTQRCFGASVLRDYMPLKGVKTEIFTELQNIGAALGAHGLTNITCIEAEGRRYYFEADLRPNAWIDHPTFFGEDPAVRIKDWFENKVELQPLANQMPAPDICLPHFLRLGFFALLTNRYKVWRAINFKEWRLMLALLLNRLSLKPYLPDTKWFRLRTYLICARHTWPLSRVPMGYFGWLR